MEPGLEVTAQTSGRCPAAAGPSSRPRSMAASRLGSGPCLVGNLGPVLRRGPASVPPSVIRAGDLGLVTQTEEGLTCPARVQPGTEAAAPLAPRGSGPHSPRPDSRCTLPAPLRTHVDPLPPRSQPPARSQHHELRGL